MQEAINKAIEEARKGRVSRSDQLTLGELTARIEAIAKKQAGRIEEGFTEAKVVYDFVGSFPLSLNTWRGSYSELALSYHIRDRYATDQKEPITVSELLQILKEVEGKTLSGYKGGEYLITKDTPVWVDNWGECHNTAIIGVVDAEYYTILLTGYCEY